jgi:hypothetical protein
LLAPINCSLDETLHTRALSYLLDPAAPHGFKKQVLASFIEKVKDVSPRGSGAAALLALLRRKRTRVTVTPEYRYRVEDFRRSVARCDIWIELHAAGAAALIIIENKIKAPEYNDQLTWYGKKADAWTKHNLKALEPLCVYLTRTDKQKLKEPSGKWLGLTYIGLAAALRKVWLENQDAVGREWLALYIASITSGVLDIKGKAVEKAALDEIEEYLWEGARNE